MMKNRDAKQNLETFSRFIQEITNEIQQVQEQKLHLQAVEQCEKLEAEIKALTDRLHAVLMGQQLQRSLNDDERMPAEERRILQDFPGRYRSEGMRPVTIKTASGVEIVIWVRYYVKQGGNRRRNKNRGVYPALLLLGIQDHCTPNLASEIGALAAAMSSYEEVQATLERRGIRFDDNTIRDLAYRLAQRARAIQQQGFADYEIKLSGKRVVVSTDGGRLRIRKNKPGKKTAKGRTRYRTDWKEPKVLIIYVVGPDGQKERSIAPFIDATMKGPNEVFALIAYYLEKLGAVQAEHVVFVADGAEWIWNRVPALGEKLGLKPNQFHQVLDFYHAVEHLTKVAGLRKSWSQKQRKSWVKKQRGLLIKGLVAKVIEAIQSLCHGRYSRSIRTELNYFITHREHMKYDLNNELGLPIGSGGIESAVRRVVNLRLKGPSIYWKRENAEAMLFLRSYYKAGRWNILKNMAFSPESPALV